MMVSARRENKRQKGERNAPAALAAFLAFPSFLRFEFPSLASRLSCFIRASRRSSSHCASFPFAPAFAFSSALAFFSSPSQSFFRLIHSPWTPLSTWSVRCHHSRPPTTFWMSSSPIPAMRTLPASSRVERGIVTRITRTQKGAGTKLLPKVCASSTVCRADFSNYTERGVSARRGGGASRTEAKEEEKRRRTNIFITLNASS
jgi:hypothetical protein